MIKKKLPNQSNAFQTAVESVHDLVSAYRKGLKALDNAAASCMVVNNSRLVDGSVDIDTTLKRKYPVFHLMNIMTLLHSSVIILVQILH